MKFFTQEWYELMSDWANHKLVERTMSEYEDYFRDAFKGLDPKIVETAQDIDFHDCKITNVKQSEQSLKILLDNSGAFTE
ncbi:DUF4085 family protein [Desulfosporosinus sp. BICA1-9]|uniref:DUF4085 family protein n=1 Tax=Desulfosporosinus sp. BICA1-9 TaxID=1531958 RepID=UPI00054BBEF5|nr:DUF4085 family protein [Desulfosporosinus sp. BICA1-9]KJS49699.1 MAG: hypothetical protein VR66_07045 [Peptococcaceae bacterium BRH_c23]KJS90056.1 MAG: hypothetical protein JL57_03710 [Desulfosporosinus sp. BICA1-9]HBW38768.1 DUF4085 domain-containing protein [Desulfosporosinus sp.]